MRWWKFGYTKKTDEELKDSCAKNSTSVGRSPTACGLPRGMSQQMVLEDCVSEESRSIDPMRIKEMEDKIASIYEELKSIKEELRLAKMAVSIKTGKVV